MRREYPARQLRIHISENDKYGERPLYEAIVERCRALEIAGATVFRGLEGYGDSAEMHQGHLTHREQPILIVMVDSPEKLEILAAAVEEMMDTGLIAASDVHAVRLWKD